MHNNIEHGPVEVRPSPQTLDDVIELLIRFGRADFLARAEVNDSDTPLNTVLAGLNMLGEELLNFKVQLSAKNELLSNVLENVCEIIYVGKFKAYRDGGFTFMSGQVESTLGYTAQQVYADGNLLFDAIHPDDRERVEQIFAGAANGNQTIGEYRIYSEKFERYVWLEDSVTAKKLEDGSLVIYGAARDVSSRKNTERLAARAYKELFLIGEIDKASITGRPSSELIELFLHSATELAGPSRGVVFIKNPANGLLSYHQSSVRSMGLQHVPEIGSEDLETLRKFANGATTLFVDDLKKIPLSLHKLFPTDRGLQFYGLLLIYAGDDIQALITLGMEEVLSHVEQESILRYIKHGNAVFAKIKAEQLLVEQKLFNESILNTLPVEIAVYDAEHRFIYVNEKSVSDHKLRAWMIGKNDFDYCKKRGFDIGLAHRRAEEFRRMMETKEETEWVDNRIGKDGKPVFFLRRYYPHIEDGVVRYAIEYGIDYTTLRLSERDREKLLKDLTHRYNELMQFNYIVSHNLRAPVSRIMGLSNLLKTEPDPTEKEMINEFMIKSAESIDQMIRDLNVILSNRSPLNEKRERFRLTELIQAVKDNLAVPLMSSGAIIHSDFEAGAEEINSIKSYVQSALHNLISNAIKYKSEGKVPVLHIRSRLVENSIVISVTDNGLGIDLEKHGAYIFGLYKRFNTEIEGKGLGLHMTKTQMEAIGGTVQVSSTPGEGSTFTIILPSDGVVEEDPEEVFASAS